MKRIITAFLKHLNSLTIKNSESGTYIHPTTKTEITWDFTNRPFTLQINIPDATPYNTAHNIITTCLKELPVQKLQFDDCDEIDYRIESICQGIAYKGNTPTVPMIINMTFTLIR